MHMLLHASIINMHISLSLRTLTLSGLQRIWGMQLVHVDPPKSLGGWTNMDHDGPMCMFFGKHNIVITSMLFLHQQDIHAHK